MPYFPAIICVECDSPIDALVSLCVPRDEAMDLVAASWRSEQADCVLATVDGGRSVAALRTPEGRWAACNAFLDYCCSTRSEAERQLQKLLKRGRRGYVGMLARSDRLLPDIKPQSAVALARSAEIGPSVLLSCYRHR